MAASLKLGEALGTCRHAQNLLLLAIQSPFTRLRVGRLWEVNTELEKAIAAIEAAVKEG